MKKAVLLTYTFPPISSGGTPVVLNMCRYLPRTGWSVLPVTVTEHVGMDLDQTLNDEMPKETKVTRVPHGGGAAGKGTRLSGPLRKALSFIMHNYILVPDRLITWKKSVMPVLLELIEREKPHCVISFGPHHSLHLIALDACTKTNLPLIPFFGDLWLADSYVKWPSRLNRFIEGLQERKVVLKARGLVATTEGSTGYFLDRYGDRCPPLHVAENGYDPRRYEIPPGEPTRGEFLQAGWTGNFFGEHSPGVLLSGLEAFFARNPSSKLRLRMAGKIDRASLNRIETGELAGRVSHIGRLEWNNVPAFQKSCEMLICYLSSDKGSRLKNSSKTAEYLASGRAILGIVPGGDMSERIIEYGRGYIVEPDTEEIASALEGIEYRWATARLSLPLDYREIEGRFSAVNIMARFGKFLDEMAAP